ncbi:MAG TPA: hypothetical protein ENJ32_11565 [Crenotrichaceae bacterium]|nr:hypothetical protein [Crenotrichaceae bacterium]
MKRGNELLILLINYFSGFYLVLGIALSMMLELSAFQLILFAGLWIYLLPALICRVLIITVGRPVGTVDNTSPVFIYWWFLTQLQMLYARLPFLEELLRFFPGLYSLWLNLWGAKVSVLTYWSPGVVIADRYHINIGRRAIIGGGCRIGAHVISLDNHQQPQLILAPVTIENSAMVGLHAAVGPGCYVHTGETVPAGKLLKPFCSVQNGRVHRPSSDR